MRRGVAIWVLAAAIAGCMGPGTKDDEKADPYRNYTNISPPVDAEGVSVRAPNCTAGGCGEYYFVHIAGSENITQVKGAPAQHGTCTRPWRFDAFPANRTLAYNASAYPDVDRRNLRTIIGEAVYSVSIAGDRYVDGCPSLYAIHPFYPTAQQPYPKRTALVGSYGSVKITVYPDGSIAFGQSERLIDLGKKLVVSYGRLVAGDEATFYVKGGFEIVNRGPWSMDALVAGSGAPVSAGQG
ncbi:MAG: hypothetical protein HYT80_07835 [Euryarchaeota archaeon]|nr:hypothetical protein [Euryarchaeota archaeon]